VISREFTPSWHENHAKGWVKATIAMIEVSLTIPLLLEKTYPHCRSLGVQGQSQMTPASSFIAKGMPSAKNIAKGP
jgi:hypothetical protein